MSGDLQSIGGPPTDERYDSSGRPVFDFDACNA